MQKLSSYPIFYKILLTLPYLFGLMDMIIRFSPIIIINFVTIFKSLLHMQKAFAFYSNNFQYLPHAIFTVLYIGIVRNQIREFSYFVRYHVMQYLVLFTFEQLLYDSYIRVCFHFFDKTFGLVGAVGCLGVVCALALDCIIHIFQGRYTDIPLVTDAVLVHIGDRRKSNS